MTAICYSQLSGFRSPWGGGLVGGVDKRLADLLGLLLPLLSKHRAGLGCVCFSPPLLFIPPFSPQSFSWHIHPSFSFFIILPFTCSPPFTLFPPPHLYGPDRSAVYGHCCTAEERERVRERV